MNQRRSRLAAGLCVVLSVAGLSGGTAGATGAPAEQARDRVGVVVKRTGPAVSIAATLSGSAKAKCRRGETLVGGGAIGDGTGFLSVYLRGSGPDPGNARRWLARGYNNDGGAAHNLRAYAMCAKSARRDRVGVIVRERGAVKTLATGAPDGKATAKCRSDERLVSGGAVGTGTGPASVILKASVPDPTRGRRWLAQASNNDFVGPQTLRAYAFCARPARPDRVEKIVKRAGAPVTVAPGTTGTAFAKCRRSEKLVGGGALGTGGTAATEIGLLLNASAPHPTNARRWRATGNNFDAVPRTLRVFAFCASH